MKVVYFVFSLSLFVVLSLLLGLHQYRPVFRTLYTATHSRADTAGCSKHFCSWMWWVIQTDVASQPGAFSFVL